MKSKVFTRRNGFIGCNTCLMLLELNFKINIIDYLENSHISVIEKMISTLQTITENVYKKLIV